MIAARFEASASRYPLTGQLASSHPHACRSQLRPRQSRLGDCACLGCTVCGVWAVAMAVGPPSYGKHNLYQRRLLWLESSTLSGPTLEFLQRVFDNTAKPY